MHIVWFLLLLVTFWSVADAQGADWPGGGFGRFLGALFLAALLTAPAFL
jgi:hypothetical protein